ncbi:MAG TPA: FAD-dependent oxidoreductase, partial [Methylocella sp.]|nr:FAD-dependent oxidoreductase [Methylocella sp.]
ETGRAAALGGFLALPPEMRKTFSGGLPLLIASQMSQVFGPALEGEEEQHYQDWALERYTCSALDLTGPEAAHKDFANPILRRPMWGGKLYLGGSETAARGTGYLEGAVEAAQRISREIFRSQKALGNDASQAQEEGAACDGHSLNASSLAVFREWVAGQSDAVFDSYHQRLSRSLSRQQRDQLTQRAVLGAMEELFSKALERLERLPFDLRAAGVERGGSALMPEVQAPFRDVMQALLDDVVAFNATSCALSNFPAEHRISKDYMQTILRDIAAAWKEFSLAANALLLSKDSGCGGRRKNHLTMGVLP